MTLKSGLRRKTYQLGCRCFVQTLTLAVFALLLWSVPAFCQSGPPPLPPSQLDRWILAGPNWPDIFGDAPLGFSNLNTAPGWSHAETALSVDTNCSAFLNLSMYDEFGEPNFLFDAGTFSWWFQANWSSTTDGGDGPANWATMLSVRKLDFKCGPIGLDHRHFSVRNEFGHGSAVQRLKPSRFQRAN